MNRSRDSASVKRYRNIGTLKNIRCSRYNLNRLCFSDIELAYNELVSIRVLVYFYDFAHYNFVHILSDHFQRLQVGTGHNHAVAELFGTYINFCIIF